MTQKTFYREINGALDLRRRIDELGALRPREKAQSAVCDRFFHDVYVTCAEPLPQGSGTDRDADDSDLEARAHEKAVVELTADVAGGELDLTARQVPFAALCDLHLQFMAACETAGVSLLPCRAKSARLGTRSGPRSHGSAIHRNTCNARRASSYGTRPTTSGLGQRTS